MSRRADTKKPGNSPLLDELTTDSNELLIRLSEPSPAPQEVPKLPIADIAIDPNQPRKRVSESGLATLAEDIRRNGVLQPVVVRPAIDWHGYVLVFGERRYLAAQRAGLSHLPAIVRTDLDEAQVLELQWQENAQREDIDDIDKALHLRRLKEVRRLSWSEMEDVAHLSRRHLIRMQQVAEMPEEVLDMLRERQITTSHTYQLARLTNDIMRIDVAQTCVLHKWSVKRLAREVQVRLTPEGVVTSMSPVQKNTRWTPLLDNLRERIAEEHPLSQQEIDDLKAIAKMATSVCKHFVGRDGV